MKPKKSDGKALKRVAAKGRKPVPAPHKPLSENEHKVLLCLANGKTIKETADFLKVSFNTADTYVRRIYSKLKVHSRAAAIVWYCRNAT